MSKEYYVGLDIGGTSAKVGLVDREGNIIEKSNVEVIKNTDWKTVVDKFIEPIIEWKKKYTIKAIGIVAPNFYNHKDGLFYNCINIPVLSEVPFVKYISDKLGIKSFADNDATAAAVGELLFGSGKNYKDFMLVTLGTGVGGGLILNERIYRGFNGFAGEFGHMVIVPEGRECNCGNRGCIEVYASATAMIKSIQSGIKKGFITNYDKSEKITAQLIFEKAKNGDVYSLEVVNNAAKYLGIALGSVINLLNLEAIIIGGGVASSGDFFINKIKFYTEQIAWKLFTKDLKIIPAQLLNDAGIIGAASLAIEEIIEEKKYC
jgi:glucokinase